MNKVCARITRLAATAALASVLFVPGLNISRAEGTMPGGIRKPFPPSDTLVQTTSTYYLFADGTEQFLSDGSVLYPSGQHIFVTSNSSTCTYWSDGTIAYDTYIIEPNGSIVSTVSTLPPSS